MSADETLLRRIEQAITPAMESMEFEFVQARFVSGKRKTLQIMAERRNGPMDIEACTNLSRTVSAILDVEDFIPGEYVLEVSSPGIDRPLIKKRDFERHQGREIKVKLNRALNGRRNFKGRLGAVEDGIIRLTTASEEGGESFCLPLADIGEAKLVLSEDLIRSDLRKAKQSDRPTRTENNGGSNC